MISSFFVSPASAGDHEKQTPLRVFFNRLSRRTGELADPPI